MTLIARSLTVFVFNNGLLKVPCGLWQSSQLI